MSDIEAQQKELKVKKEVEDRHTGELVPLLCKAIKLLGFLELLQLDDTSLLNWYNEHRIRKSMLILESQNIPFITLTDKKLVHFIKDYTMLGIAIKNENNS